MHTYISPIDGRKSFGGKAVAIKDGNTVYLQSYDTIVGFVRNGNFHRTWDGYSATTMRHVNAFLAYCSVDGGGKAWWESLPIEKLPTEDLM